MDTLYRSQKITLTAKIKILPNKFVYNPALSRTFGRARGHINSWPITVHYKAGLCKAGDVIVVFGIVKNEKLFTLLRTTCNGSLTRSNFTYIQDVFVQLNWWNL